MRVVAAFTLQEWVMASLQAEGEAAVGEQELFFKRASKRPPQTVKGFCGESPS